MTGDLARIRQVLYLATCDYRIDRDGNDMVHLDECLSCAAESDLSRVDARLAAADKLERAATDAHNLLNHCACDGSEDDLDLTAVQNALDRALDAYGKAGGA